MRLDFKGTVPEGVVPQAITVMYWICPDQTTRLEHRIRRLHLFPSSGSISVIVTNHGWNSGSLGFIRNARSSFPMVQFDIITALPGASFLCVHGLLADVERETFATLTTAPLVSRPRVRPPKIYRVGRKFRVVWHTETHADPITTRQRDIDQWVAGRLHTLDRLLKSRQFDRFAQLSMEPVVFLHVERQDPQEEPSSENFWESVGMPLNAWDYFEYDDSPRFATIYPRHGHASRFHVLWKPVLNDSVLSAASELAEQFGSYEALVSALAGLDGLLDRITASIHQQPITLKLLRQLEKDLAAHELSVLQLSHSIASADHMVVPQLHWDHVTHIRSVLQNMVRTPLRDFSRDVLQHTVDEMVAKRSIVENQARRLTDIYTIRSTGSMLRWTRIISGLTAIVLLVAVISNTVVVQRFNELVHFALHVWRRG